MTTRLVQLGALLGAILGMTALWHVEHDAEEASAMTEREVRQAERAVSDIAVDRGHRVPGERSRRAHRERQQEFSPEMIEQTIEVARTINPEMADRLRALCDNDPEEFARVMQRSGQRLIGLVHLKQRDPELYEVRVDELRIDEQVNDLARQLADALKAEDMTLAADLEVQLRGHIREQLAYSIRARAMYINRLKEHIEALKDEIDQDVRQFEDSVEQRLTEVVDRHRSITIASDD